MSQRKRNYVPASLQETKWRKYARQIANQEILDALLAGFETDDKRAHALLKLSPYLLFKPSKG